jgi:lipoate---protein ligase
LNIGIMLAINSTVHDPCFNLATEDYLLHKSTEDYIILSVNDPSVVIGKHQVIYKEVDTHFTTQKNIPVIRRISGGGTVFHDRGNLNFAFILKSLSGKQVDFRLYTKPVIEFLNRLGINAIFEGKSDIRVDGRKISGNAEHVFRERVLHHGTLLFSSSLDDMRLALKKESDQYTTHAVDSNRTSVMNINFKLPSFNSIESFTDSMLSYLLEYFPETHKFDLSDKELSEISKLADSKYRTWEWNYAYGPPYTLNRSLESGGKVVSIMIHVKDGIIDEFHFDGNEEISASCEKLIGCRHFHADLKKKITEASLPVPDEMINNFF